MIRKPQLLRGRIDRFLLDSKSLAGNRLGDPSRREVCVYLPPEYEKQPQRRFPVFVDLVGFMGSGQAHLNWKGFDESVPQRLERLVKKKLREQIRQAFGLEVHLAGRILKSQFVITIHRVTQVAVRCNVRRGRVTARAGRRTKWVTLRGLQDAPLPSSQKGIAHRLSGDGISR